LSTTERMRYVRKFDFEEGANARRTSTLGTRPVLRPNCCRSFRDNAGGINDGIADRLPVLRIAPEEDTYNATTEALCRTLGDHWFERHHKFIITEIATGRTLCLQQEAPNSVRIACDCARWDIEMRQPDADGFGGYADVVHVTSAPAIPRTH